VYSPVKDANTTVPQFENINPTAPIPSIAGRNQVAPCGLGGREVPGASTTTTKPPGG
jgi:hypothetical protein